MKLLLTGFERFHSYKTNPSMEVASLLNGKQINNFEVTSVVLPVSFHETFHKFAQSRPEKYDFIIMLGLAFTRYHFSLEKIAYNYIQDTRTDNNGIDLKQKTIIADENKYNKLDLFGFNNILKQQSLPTELSFCAGTYLCNYLLFKCLETYKNPSIFIHIPADKKLNSKSSYSLENLAEITAKIIGRLDYFF